MLPNTDPTKCETCGEPATVRVADMQEIEPSVDPKTGERHARYAAAEKHHFCHDHKRASVTTPLAPDDEVPFWEEDDRDGEPCSDPKADETTEAVVEAPVEAAAPDPTHTPTDPADPADGEPRPPIEVPEPTSTQANSTATPPVVIQVEQVRPPGDRLPPGIRKRQGGE